MTGFDSKRQAAQDKVAQPEQEPVAWAVYYKGGGSKSLHWPENHSPNGDATKFDAVPLYTTSPKREWVGLTDDEFDKIYDQHIQTEDYAESMAMVAAKLKEKNFD